MAAKYDLTIYAGATMKRWFAFRKPDGTIADPPNEGSGYAIGRLTIRDMYGGAEILSLTTANGGIVLGLETDAEGRQWSGYLYASATATAALVDFGDGVFDFEISDGFDVIRMMQGKATLSREVTT